MSDIVAQVGAQLDLLTTDFETVAHNLANVRTAGYKRRVNSFSRTLIEEDIGSDAEVGYEIDVNTAFDFSQGGLMQSRDPLNLALNGKGFFTLETPDGPLYTRNGSFKLDTEGRIVDLSGRFVAGDSGPITIPATASISEITVSSDGSITAAGLPVGKFKISDFGEDEKKLKTVGNSCFVAPPEIKPDVPEDTQVKQGFRENSNVNIMEELVNMMMVTRLYQANMSFVSVNRDTASSIIGVAMG